MGLRESLDDVALATLLLTAVLACSRPASEPGAANRSAARSDPPETEASKPEGDVSGVTATEPFGAAALARHKAPFIGDLDEMRQRRLIRVLVSHSKSSFFYDRGHPKGFEVELLRALEAFLNDGALIEEKVRIGFIPTRFDRLLEDLEQGRGDIAASGLTITAARSGRVDFSEPYLSDVHEILVTNRSLAGLKSTEDLAGRRVFVRAGSSYAEHLAILSEGLVAKRLPAIEIVDAIPELVTEDLLEMVHAGVLPLTVADAHIAELWAGVLPQILVRNDLVIHRGGGLGWAVRRENPKLLAILNAFLRRNRKGTLLGNILFKRYFAQTDWIDNPISEVERSKLDEGAALFRRYASRYDLDWLALAAQAYQESGLDQAKTSPAGAVGIMQVLPSTAADPSIGISDITTLENNLHAGAKYLALLRDRYFSEPEIDPKARVDFAWAAYNAGPARIRRLRRKAEERGFDPNRWFENVEMIAAEEIGRETVDYVANINKYYLAYRLGFEADRRRQAARATAVTQ